MQFFERGWVFLLNCKGQELDEREPQGHNEVIPLVELHSDDHGAIARRTALSLLR
jgi:hypothetical protein